MRSTMLFALCLAAVGCSDTDTKNAATNNSSPDMATSQDRTCGEIIDDVNDLSRNVPLTCSSDTDCRITVFGFCTCPRPHASDEDLDNRISTLLDEYDVQQCVNVTGCNSEPYCLFGGQSDTACVDSACVLIPAVSCDELEANPGGGVFDPDGVPAFCSSAADCELRTDTNLCGCPEAVLKEEAAAIAAAVERTNCSTDACAALDCAAGTSVDCVANGCVLVE